MLFEIFEIINIIGSLILYHIHQSDINSVCRAIPTQQVATHGLSLSPTLASFQKVPSKPLLFLSRIEGQKERM